MDLAIEEVGDRIFRLPLPIPFEVGPVNCYLVRRDEPALVDSGPRTDGAWQALLAHFAALGFDPAELRHVVATHAHVDHHGNLKRIADAAPRAALYAHEADVHGIFEHDANMLAKVDEIRRLIRFWGYPEAIVEPVLKGYMSFRKFAETVDRARLRPIEGAEAEIALGRETRARAIHCPGHTEGLICLHLEEGEGTLFASDHILETITPNPTVYLPPYRGRRTGLADYVDSLARLRALRAARVLPGHGPAFGGLAARIDAILRHHEERKEKILALLGAAAAAAGTPPPTVIELVLQVWPALAPEEYYLACREVQGHLDLLIEDGAAREEIGSDGAARFRRAHAVRAAAN